MLNPIDTDDVIRDGGAIGRFPGQIHEGVAWWLGACFVVVTGSVELAVGCDSNPRTAEFFRRFCKGAVNARHYACKVIAVSGIAEHRFADSLRHRVPLAGAYLQTQTQGLAGADMMRIRLYDDSGQPLQEATGLARIRRMIAEDRVPIPVSASAKGSIEHVAPATWGKSA